MKITLVFFLLIFNLLAFAHAGQNGADGAVAQPAQKDALTLPQLVEWLLKDGKDRIGFNSRLAAPLRLPLGGVPTKARGYSAKESLDQNAHACSLVVGESHDKMGIEPRCLILMVGRDNRELLTTDSYAFRLGLEGSLENAVLSRGKIQSDGKPVRGSATDTVLKTDDPDVSDKARKELDFWLKKGYELSRKSKREDEVLKRAEQGVPTEEKVP